MPGDCVLGTVRLVGSYSNHEGYIERCKYGEWWAVCQGDDDINNMNTASVVCRQLGFPGNSKSCIIDTYRESQPIYISKLHRIIDMVYVILLS